MLIWLPVTLAMAAVTPPSPASTRAIGSIAPIHAMPALAGVAAWRWAGGRWRRIGRLAVAGAGAALLAGNAAWTVRDYFFVWPANPEVRTIYRADLAAVARYLDQARPEGSVLISARFAADLDRQTFDYMLEREREIKWFDARRALVIPTLHAEAPLTYAFPRTDPAPPASREFLMAAAPQVELLADCSGAPAAELFRLTPAGAEVLQEAFQRRPGRELSVNLGDEIDLLGYDLPDAVPAGSPIDLRVYWRVRRGGRGDLRYAFFAHVLDERGFRWTQDDPTGFPPNSWWAGDLVIQSFELTMPADAPPGPYSLDLGFYEQGSGRRLAQVRADGSVGPDALHLGPIAAVDGRRPAAEELSITERVDADFGERIRLIGYDIGDRILNLEERVEVALTWEALAGGAGDVEIELSLTSEDGETLPLLRRRLVDGAYPLHEWPAGRVTRDRFWLIHESHIPRAVYTLHLAVRDRATGEYLETAGGRAISLGQVFMRGLRE